MNIDPFTLAELEDALNRPRVTLPIGTDTAVNQLVARAASAANFVACIERMDADEASRLATLDVEAADIEPDPVKWVRYLMDEVDRLLDEVGRLKGLH